MPTARAPRVINSMLVSMVLAIMPISSALAQSCEDEWIAPPDPLAEESFGRSLAIDNTTLVVGAPGTLQGTSPLPGRAFVYELIDQQWVYLATLSCSDAHDGDSFGAAVAIDDDVIAVGSPRSLNPQGVKTGAVCVYFRPHDGWQTTDTPDFMLFPPNQKPGKLFGIGLDISGDWIIAGAPLSGKNPRNAGAAFAYEFDGREWIVRQMLTRPSPTRNEHFGFHVVIEDDMAVVTAPNIFVHSLSGTAHVFLSTLR